MTYMYEKHRNEIHYYECQLKGLIERKNIKRQICHGLEGREGLLEADLKIL